MFSIRLRRLYFRGLLRDSRPGMQDFIPFFLQSIPASQRHNPDLPASIGLQEGCPAGQRHRYNH